MLSKYNEPRFLRVVFILTLAVFNILRSITLLLIEFPYKTPLLLKLQELMPLPVYGIILLTSAVLLVVSLFLKGAQRSSLMIIGGLLGSVALALYGSASSLEVDNLLEPFRYILLSLANLTIAIAGGLTLWQTRKRNM